MLHCFDGIVCGASGGDVDCISPTSARARELQHGVSCSVMCFGSFLYRTDFLGWRSFSFEE
jgi:hypothetical protein